MGTKLLWSGLTFIMAVPAFAAVLGLHPERDTLVAIGAVVMVIGAVLLWISK
jgi:hypothetical protein